MTHLTGSRDRDPRVGLESLLKMEPSGDKPTEMAALGRPFDLGMLYDCRSEALIPGMTLWDKEKLDKDMKVIPKPKTELKIVASESISDKSFHLCVEASLSASFLSGLVKVEGSAKYLNDNKKSTKQARVTLQYEITTEFKYLTMDQLGRDNIKHCKVVKENVATHVVTGILFGAQAFFVFDRETVEDENVQDIQGSLKATIENIPKITIDGSGSVQMEEEEKKRVNKFSCTFYGDFHPDDNPTTFEESVKVYKDLPKLLGKNKEKVVPLTVYLYPLSKLDLGASSLVREISLTLVQDAEKILENFHELEMRCNDVLTSPAGKNFSIISKKIKTFKAHCYKFKLGLQRKLAQKLPSIRGGGEEESALAEVLKEVAESPFDSDRLNQWMEEREEEADHIKILIKLMKNTEIVSSKMALINKVCDCENALVFVLTSLDSTEPFLSELDKHLKKSSPSRSDTPEPRRWYSSDAVIDSVRLKAKAFGDFAEANEGRDKKSLQFLAVGLEDESHEGSTIFHYKYMTRVNDNLDLPSKPAAVTVEEVTHSSVSLLFSAPSQGAQSITGYRVEYCEKGQEEWNQRPQAEAGAVTVTGLSPNTEYSIRVRADTAVGAGPAADLTVTTEDKDHAGLADDYEEEMKAALQNIDLAPAAEKAQKYLDKFNNVRVNIAITGESGSGKSTLVNALRGIRNKTEGAAPTGSRPTTTEPTEYRHPSNPNITIWDLPGVGTTSLTAREYLKYYVESEKYDFFIIVSSHRFTENDAKLAQEIQKMKKKFYFVRSQIDSNIQNEKEEDPNVKVKNVLKSVRDNCTEELQKLGFESPKIFLVSGFRLHLYEFKDLCKTLEMELPEHQRDALLLALPNISLDVIDQKKNTLESRIKWLTVAAAAQGADLSVCVHLDTIVTFTELCVESLGLTPQSLQKLSAVSGVSLEDLKKELKSPLAAAEITPDLVLKVLASASVHIKRTVAENVLRFIPTIGTISEMTLSGVNTSKALYHILNTLAEDAYRVFIKVTG